MLVPIILKNHSTEICLHACTVIRYVSRNINARARLENPKVGVLEALVYGAKGNIAKECCLATLGNICSNKDIVEHLTSKKLGLVAIAIENLKNSGDAIIKLRSARILTNISNILSSSNCMIMHDHGAVQLALEIIRDDGGVDPLQWPGGAHNGYIGGCVTLLQSICRFRSIATEAKALGARDILAPLILVPPAVSTSLFIFASFAMAFISGRDEATNDCDRACTSLLQRYPEIYRSILTVLENTLTGKSG